MVGVVVREEDLTEVEQSDVRLHQLSLRALGAVDQQTVAAAAKQERRRRAATRRHRAGGAEKHDVEVHRASVGTRLSGSGCSADDRPEGPSVSGGPSSSSAGNAET